MDTTLAPPSHPVDWVAFWQSNKRNTAPDWLLVRWRFIRVLRHVRVGPWCLRVLCPTTRPDSGRARGPRGLSRGSTGGVHRWNGETKKATDLAGLQRRGCRVREPRQLAPERLRRRRCCGCCYCGAPPLLLRSLLLLLLPLLLLLLLLRPQARPPPVPRARPKAATPSRPPRRPRRCPSNGSNPNSDSCSINKQTKTHRQHRVSTDSRSPQQRVASHDRFRRNGVASPRRRHRTRKKKATKDDTTSTTSQKREPTANWILRIGLAATAPYVDR